MEDRWHIFFKDPWLHFVRSWTGFCVYKVRLEKSDAGYRVAEVWINRDRRQYGGTDALEDAQRLSFLIEHLLVGWEQRSLLRAVFVTNWLASGSADHEMTPGRASPGLSSAPMSSTSGGPTKKRHVNFDAVGPIQRRPEIENALVLSEGSKAIR
jgi:hypothetical protein